MRVLANTVVVLVLAATLSEAGQRELPGSFGVSVNPAGLQLGLGVGQRWGLYGSSARLLKDAHVSIRLTNRLNPSYNRLEASAELSPLSILDLKASAELMTYFGNFGHLTGFQSYDDDFSRDVRSARKGESLSAVGHRLALSPTLKFRAGRLSFRAGADFEWWAVNRPEPFFYEPARATLLRSDGDSLVAASALALLDVSRTRSRRMEIGVLYDATHVWDAPQNRKQRLGPMFAVKLVERCFGMRAPVLFAGVSYYLEQPTTDSRVSGFAALGFSLGR